MISHRMLECCGCPQSRNDWGSRRKPRLSLERRTVMSYSPFFQTLHDETRPVGQLGRGTHYSILRVPIWQDEWLNLLAQGLLLDFAVIWDEDHDARVMEAVEALYFSGLLSPVRFIGERKGSL